MKPQEIVIRVVVEQSTAPAPAEFKEVGAKERTPSQELRLALLKKYNALNDHKDEPFEAYYKRQMERIISAVTK